MVATLIKGYTRNVCVLGHNDTFSIFFVFIIYHSFTFKLNIFVHYKSLPSSIIYKCIYTSSNFPSFSSYTYFLRGGGRFTQAIRTNFVV